MHVPSPFNCQSGRIVLVTGERSYKLWKTIVKPAFLNTLGGDGRSPFQPFGYFAETSLIAAQIKANATKILEYAQGYGTILFFEDEAVLDGLRARLPKLVLHMLRSRQWLT